jgi:hypothetical protein
MDDDQALGGDAGLGHEAAIARQLGRIEATLESMGGDIQASVRSQEATMVELKTLDRRVMRLEDKEDARTRYSRVASLIGLALLVPAINAAQHAYHWVYTVGETYFQNKE